MSIVDLRVRRFGDHEENSFAVSINDKSAHVTMTALGIMFAVDREDVPAAWDAKIDVAKLHTELVATIIRRMSVGVLNALFREISDQRQHAFWDGENTARSKIKKALGL
jgi:hypothetical protein